MTAVEQTELMNKSKQSFGNASAIEMGDNQSAISLNNELFKGLDSIS